MFLYFKIFMSMFFILNYSQQDSNHLLKDLPHFLISILFVQYEISLFQLNQSKKNDSLIIMKL